MATFFYGLMFYNASTFCKLKLTFIFNLHLFLTKSSSLYHLKVTISMKINNNMKISSFL